LRNPLWAASANLFDFDRDGFLDLVVVNYLVDDPTHVCLNKKGERTYCGPLMFPGTVTKLFRNLGCDGKGVRFEDVTVKAGLATAGWTSTSRPRPSRPAPSGSRGPSGALLPTAPSGAACSARTGGGPAGGRSWPTSTRTAGPTLPSSTGR